MSVQPERLFGRRQIFYDDVEITRDNVQEIVSQIMPIHRKNARDIQRLYRIFKGEQSIFDKVKTIRPEINNQIIANYPLFIVVFKTAYLLGKPIQYVSRGKKNADVTDEISEKIDILNGYADDCDKEAKDIEIAECFNICGTAYRYVDVQNNSEDESPFNIYTLDPRRTCVVKSNAIGNAPIFAVHTIKNRSGEKVYNVWTRNKLFVWEEPLSGNAGIVKESTHYLGRIPVIEYPANNSRLGAFEIVLSLTDAINAALSDLADGREQFINALLVLKGVDIEEENFKKIREYGGLLVPHDGDVKYLVSELNQSQNGDTINLMIDIMLEIAGMPKRSGGNGGTSDNGVAVFMRDGFADASARAISTERTFKKSEREMLRIVLLICDALRGIKLPISAIETHFERMNTDNILSKAQALVTMLQTDKIHPELAMEASGIFSDPNNAYRMSIEYADAQIEREEQILAESVTDDTHVGGDEA